MNTPIPEEWRDYPWMMPDPFVVDWQIHPEHIDHYNHVNNVAYVAQLEKVAWAHSNALGLDIQTYQRLDRGMAISKHMIEYHAAALLNDRLLCATWILACDKRLKLSRQFQYIRLTDKKTMLTAKTDFVCIALSSGKPKRMPREFTGIYGPAIIDRFLASSQVSE